MQDLTSFAVPSRSACEAAGDQCIYTPAADAVADDLSTPDVDESTDAVVESCGSNWRPREETRFLGGPPVEAGIVAGEARCARIRLQASGQHAHRGRLACPVGSEKAEHFAALDREGHPIDRQVAAKAFYQRVCNYHGEASPTCVCDLPEPGTSQAIAGNAPGHHSPVRRGTRKPVWNAQGVPNRGAARLGEGDI